MQKEVVFGILVMLLFSLFVGTASAIGNADVVVQANVTEVEKGQSFTVTITMNDDGHNITAWKIYEFTYQPAGLVEITSVEIPSGSFWADTTFSDLGDYDNGAGTLTNTQAFDGRGTRGMGASDLITISFTAKNSGTVYLNINNFRAEDETATEVDFSITNDVVTVPGDGGNGGNGGNGNGGPPPPTNQKPTADASASPRVGYINEPVVLDGSLSSDSDGSVAAYRWDFDGDEVWDTEWMITSTYPYTYTSKGEYIVSLEVKDDDGAVDEDVVTITIYEVAPDNQLPVADAGGPYEGCIGELILFSGNGSYDSDGEILFYEWHFGDNTSASGSKVATQKFFKSGTYTITLNVTDDDGAISQDTATLTVIDCDGTEPPDNGDGDGDNGGQTDDEGIWGIGKYVVLAILIIVVLFFLINYFRRPPEEIEEE
jgi:PKD repeat protein